MLIAKAYWFNGFHEKLKVNFSCDLHLENVQFHNKI